MGEDRKRFAAKGQIIKIPAWLFNQNGHMRRSRVFSIVGLLLSDNLIYLVFTGIILLIIFYYFPSPEKLELQIDLNQTELDELKK
jgi:hypothetical protein